MAVLALQNLVKYFGSIHAVDDVSFSVEAGEVFGFLGPNGAGKTTTIRCVMDFLRPTSGSVTLFGKDHTQSGPEVRRRMGYLSGYVQLYDRWTGQDHIDFVRRTNGVTDGAKVLVERLDFNPKRKAKHLSSGNRQKLALILALMKKPELLILDEPTTGLDPLLQNTIYDILQEATNDGTAVFMSSHNLAEVERVCSRVAIIRSGKIVATERIEDLKHKRLYRIHVYFQQPAQGQLLNLYGAQVKKLSEHGLFIQYSGELNHLLAVLTQHPVRDITISHASLEEIFLEFYHKQQ